VTVGRTEPSSVSVASRLWTLFSTRSESACHVGLAIARVADTIVKTELNWKRILPVVCISLAQEMRAKPSWEVDHGWEAS
jgi:hypothetical protein